MSTSPETCGICRAYRSPSPHPSAVLLKLNCGCDYPLCALHAQSEASRVFLGYYVAACGIHKSDSALALSA